MTNSDTLLPNLPDAARVWIYMADRLLSEEECQHVLEGLEGFLLDWTSHQRVVMGEAGMVENRFLILAATLKSGDISGCGIDKSVHLIESLAKSHGFSWLDGLHVALESSSGIETLTRPEFRKRVRGGLIDADSRVCDLSAATLGELRSQGLIRPARDSWHARVFGIPVAEGA